MKKTPPAKAMDALVDAEHDIKPDAQDLPTLLTVDCEDSTMFSDASYDQHRRVMRLTFRSSGQVHEFIDVPYSIWEGLTLAESKGAYFNRIIRSQHFGSHIVG